MSLSGKPQSTPYIIVLGNEKGGTGKSTTAMHLITSLLRSGFTVGSIDIDARQGTLTRYFENRHTYAKDKRLNPSILPIPNHIPLNTSSIENKREAEQQDEENFNYTLQNLQQNDFIVIDTPGHDLFLSRLAHSYADTLITPLNDSFVDLDVIAHVNSETFSIIKPSLYAEWVWEQKKKRALRDRSSIEWIVIRNRLTTIHAKNKENMEKVLQSLSKRIGFRLISGFSERVVFRELFLSGLTLLDLKEIGLPLNLSHIAARQELRTLIQAINLPTSLQERFKAS